MRGRDWTDLMAAVKETIEFIISRPTLKNAIKITVICYGHRSRVVFKEENPSLDLIDKIVFGDGGTNFELALTETYDRILESKDKYESFAVGFLTDGEAEYPQKIIDKINADADKIKQKIKFNCILFGSESSNLEMISKNLDGNYTNAINFEQLTKSFKEIINVAN